MPEKKAIKSPPKKASKKESKLKTSKPSGKNTDTPKKESKPQKTEQNENTPAKNEPRNNSIPITPTILIVALLIAITGIYLYQNMEDTAPTGDTTPTGAQRGNIVYIMFTMKYENGTIIDTNYQDIAEEAGLEKESYPPLIFRIGEGLVPKGLEDAVIGMKPAEKKTITLTPDDAYGPYKNELSVEAERIQTQNRTITAGNYESMTSARFQELFNKRAAILGNEVKTYATPWNYTITEVQPDNITVKAKTEVGKTYKLPDMPWNATVISVTDKDTIFRLDPEEGSIIDTQIGPATVTTTDDNIILTINPEIGDTYMLDDTTAKVTRITDTTITLDANHPLAGKTLIFDIELLQITRDAEE